MAVDALISPTWQRWRQPLSLLLAAFAAAAVMGVNESAHRLAHQALDNVRQRQAARDDIMALQRQLLEAESAQRGYLLTGRVEYATPLLGARKQLPEIVRRLRGHYDYTAWHQKVDALQARVEEKLAELQESLNLFEAGSHPAWQAILMSNIGKEKMDAVRAAVEQLLAYEGAEIERSRAAVLRSLDMGRLGVHGLTVLSLLWLLFFLRKNQALHEAQRDHAKALAGERDRLDAEVLRRTGELVELARHQQTMREDERAHLARELHDELGALLTAAKMDLARLRRTEAHASADLHERLRHMGQLIDEGIALKRRIIEDLRPSALSNLGLTAALEILAREFGQRSGLEVSTEIEEIQTDASGQLAIYRLVQEALTNVARHAQARRVWLKVQDDPAVLSGSFVSVRDDGRGFDPGSLPVGRHGLVGMKFRVEAMGGMVQIRSKPGQGTEIEAHVPPLESPAPEPISPLTNEPNRPGPGYGGAA